MAEHTENSLIGKVALVTGGVRRIGAVVCRLLHAQGMNLVIHYRSSEKEAHALQAELHALRPESVMLVRGDLLNAAKLDNLVYETIDSFERLDALINNASSFYPTPMGNQPVLQHGRTQGRAGRSMGRGGL